jgi:hypothetical protein
LVSNTWQAACDEQVNASKWSGAFCGNWKWLNCWNLKVQCKILNVTIDAENDHRLLISGAQEPV